MASDALSVAWAAGSPVLDKPAHWWGIWKHQLPASAQRPRAHLALLLVGGGPGVSASPAREWQEMGQQ